jgi:signal transduction histidine kinase
VTPGQWASHQADLDARRPFNGFQFERLGPQGEVRHIRIAGKPVFAADGTFRGYRGIARDVTVEVAAEKELERRVAERTEELHAAQGELLRAERLATLGRLTATVSHELRNPLGVIRNSVFTVAEAARTGGLKLDRPLERIDRSIKRCDGIITELLDYTRVRDLQREPVAVDPWLSELLDEQKLPVGIALERRLAAPGITISCDPNRLRRAVINLVENAAHALADSTGKSAAREGAVVTVVSGASGGRLEIAVRDNGPGIPADVLPKIFEPLFSTKSFGVGLGLPTVKQIMEQHGGGIDLGPLAEGGTEVKLWLALGAEALLEAAE